MAGSKSSSRRSLSAQRKQQALEFRRAGLSFEKIGSQLGISKTQAYNLVTKALRDLAEKTREEAAQVRTLELDRLDRMLLGLWTNATGGNVKAVEKVLKIMERRAKLLGLDMPTKVAPTDPDGTAPYREYTDEEIDQRIRELWTKVGEDAD